MALRSSTAAASRRLCPIDSFRRSEHARTAPTLRAPSRRARVAAAHLALVLSLRRPGTGPSMAPSFQKKRYPIPHVRMVIIQALLQRRPRDGCELLPERAGAHGSFAKHVDRVKADRGMWRFEAPQRFVDILLRNRAPGFGHFLHHIGRPIRLERQQLGERLVVKRRWPGRVVPE